MKTTHCFEIMQTIVRELSKKGIGLIKLNYDATGLVAVINDCSGKQSYTLRIAPSEDLAKNAPGPINQGDIASGTEDSSEDDHACDCGSPCEAVGELCEDCAYTEELDYKAQIDHETGASHGFYL